MTSPSPDAGARDWRLLVTEPTDGATNMAIDEAVWRERQRGAAPPTVRFFAWDPPTVSLGYGQPLEADVDVAACRRLGVGLVRRPTGGSAIYHDGPARELTYSVIATSDDLGGIGDLLETYRWIGRALLHGLNALGAGAELVAVTTADGPAPAFCFARTGSYEIEIGGRKVVGSAQRRQGKSFLQHGAVMLGVDEPRLRALFPTTRDPLATMTTLEAALGRRPEWQRVAHALAEGFEREHGLVLKPDGLRPGELARAEELARTRYATDAWLAGVS
ncbi:MAG TPA: lipoate--protein ligase family protein [Methylomirabilota bacterium]